MPTVIGCRRVPEPPAKIIPRITKSSYWTRSPSVSSVAASADVKSSCRNTEVTWSCTTRKAVAGLVTDSSSDAPTCSATTTPSCTYILPSSAVPRPAAAHLRSASWPCAAPCASPISMSSLERATKVSRSAALRASCQARTVASSDVVMVSKLPCPPGSQRGTVQPASPHGVVAEHLNAGVGDCRPAQYRQQELRGFAPQRHTALAVLVRPGDLPPVDGDGPFAGVTEPGVGRVQVQSATLLQGQRRTLAPGLDRDPLEPFGDGVRRHVGFEREPGAERDGGVGAVDRGLMQSAPDPP